MSKCIKARDYHKEEKTTPKCILCTTNLFKRQNNLKTKGMVKHISC